jgi:hypothetical protein
MRRGNEPDSPVVSSRYRACTVTDFRRHDRPASDPQRRGVDRGRRRAGDLPHARACSDSASACKPRLHRHPVHAGPVVEERLFGRRRRGERGDRRQLATVFRRAAPRPAAKSRLSEPLANDCVYPAFTTITSGFCPVSVTRDTPRSGAAFIVY